MRRLLGLFLVLCLVLLAPLATAPEPARLALLIGNQGYTQKVRPLENPHHDVDLVAASLTYVRLRQFRGKVRFTRTLAELKADRPYVH